MCLKCGISSWGIVPDTGDAHTLNDEGNVPTDAHPNILDRDIAHVSARPAADTVSVLLREVVNHATMALVRCEGAGCGEENVDLAALFLYRHMIEMTDGVDVLVLESAVTPAVPLLRSVFEASLALEYILEDSGKYKERALSWIAYYAIRRREGFRRLDHTRPENAEFEADRVADVHGDRVVHVKQEQVEFAIKNMDELLEHENLQRACAYAGITGNVNVALNFVVIGPRLANGTCNLKESAKPAAQYGNVTGSGTVSY